MTTRSGLESIVLGNAEWTLFRRDLDGRPRLISSRVVPAERRSELPYLVLARLRYESQPNGLPAGNEFARVSKLEGKLEEVLQGQGALHVGHATHGSHMIVAFYSPHPAPASANVRVGILRSETIPLESKLDPEWSWFREELEPTEVEREVVDNMQLHQKLEEAGDVASKVRPVDFNCFFTTPDDRDRFLESALQDGFRLGQAGTWSTAHTPPEHACQLTVDMTIEKIPIAEKCIFLRHKAEEFNGEFDGWACHVTK